MVLLGRMFRIESTETSVATEEELLAWKARLGVSRMDRIEEEVNRTLGWRVSARLHHS